MEEGAGTVSTVTLKDVGSYLYDGARGGIFFFYIKKKKGGNAEHCNPGGTEVHVYDFVCYREKVLGPIQLVKYWLCCLPLNQIKISVLVSAHVI